MAILYLMSGSHLELSKMAATLTMEFDIKGIFLVFEVFNSLLVEESLLPLKIHHCVPMVTSCCS